MQYSRFIDYINSISTGHEIASQTCVWGHLVQESADGTILIDRAATNLPSLDAAVEDINRQKVSEDIQRDIRRETYEILSKTAIAGVIRKHHSGIRITDTLIESYLELANSKNLTTDPVAQDIRRYNKIDHLIEGYVDYLLDDGTTVVVSEDVQQKLNNVFGQHSDVIEYMRESNENFLNVLNQLEE